MFKRSMFVASANPELNRRKLREQRFFLCYLCLLLLGFFAYSVLATYARRATGNGSPTGEDRRSVLSRPTGKYLLSHSFQR